VPISRADSTLTSPNILELVDVSKAFGLRRSVPEIIRRRPAPRLIAVDRVSLDLSAKRTLGIVGESGSGKSTLARLIVRLMEVDSGHILLHGEDVNSFDRDRLKDMRRRVQLIYQDPFASLNPRMKIGDAIIEAAKVHGLVTRATAEPRLSELLDQVGLPHALVSRRPQALSGGQRQRVAIARSLATNPEIVIADEALSALDVSVQAQIMNLFVTLKNDLGLTLIMISHQLPVIAQIADEVVVMYLGSVVERGPVADVFSAPAHPYTAALMAAQPGPARRGRRQPALRGEIPSALDLPTGCRFRTRCPLAMPICAEVTPPQVNVTPEHSASCHLIPSGVNVSLNGKVARDNAIPGSERD
jgi:oligopeptide transport system ATP-binding protein